MIGVMAHRDLLEFFFFICIYRGIVKTWARSEKYTII
jgi:hypothetical protein